jgi:GlpG protein
MADKIANDLLLRGISGGVEIDEKGMCHLYVHREVDLLKALDFFRVTIGHPPSMEMPEEWEKIKKLPMGNFTFSILAICVVIFGVGWMLKETWVYEALMFGPREKEAAFAYISSGEIWRVITPAFIHFGFLHVLFNLLWWKDLGNILENTKGPFFLAAFLIITAAISNILQAIMTGANFGGLSGVVYALLGYLWIYKKVHPQAEYGLPKSDVILMIGWFVLCLMDVFSFGVANWAHGGGLVMGMIIGGIYGLIDRKS